jgi:hypothetical protein
VSSKGKYVKLFDLWAMHFCKNSWNTRYKSPYVKQFWNNLQSWVQTNFINIDNLYLVLKLPNLLKEGSGKEKKYISWNYLLSLHGSGFNIDTFVPV